MAGRQELIEASIRVALAEFEGATLTPALVERIRRRVIEHAAELDADPLVSWPVPVDHAP